MPTAFEALKQKSAIAKPNQTGGTSAFEALKNKQVTAPVSQETPVEEGGGVGGFVKSLVSAPLTMLGRPVQAVAELAGASSETVNKYTKKLTGGFVAPVPESFKDVKKDVGRAIQTVGFGAAGPVSAGAAIGLGSSLEQGNDLFSTQTAFNTALGAVGGKVLDLVGKPLINASGKVVGKITPQTLKDVAAKGSNAIKEFAATHKILSDSASKALTAGAEKAETIANKPFEVSGRIIKGAFIPSPEKTIQKRVNTLQRLEDNNSRVRSYIAKQNERGFDVKKDIASTDLLQGSVDNTGTIRTKQDGGAVSQYNEFIKPQEGVVNKALVREGKFVPLKDIEKDLIHAVNNSGVKGASRTEALSKVAREIEGYKIELDPLGKKTVEEIMMPVSSVHAAKVDKYANVNYLNENGRVDKAIAKTLKKIVEKNTESVDVKALNTELSKHYANIGFLEKLDGTKVEGGRLGKHFARTIGAIAGSHFGPLGAIAGSELAGAVKGASMSTTFGKKIGRDLESSALMKSVLKQQEFTKLPVKSLPSEFTNELPTIPFGTTPKPKVSDLPVVTEPPKVYSNNFGNRNAIQPKVTTASKTSISKSIGEQSADVNIPKNLEPLAQEVKKYKSIDEALPKNISVDDIKDAQVFGSSVKGEKYNDIDVALFIDENHATLKKIGSEYNKKVGNIEYHVLPNNEYGRDIFDAMLDMKKETGKGINVALKNFKGFFEKAKKSKSNFGTPKKSLPEEKPNKRGLSDPYRF